jgi:hypothetical protein
MTPVATSRALTRSAGRFALGRRRGPGRRVTLRGSELFAHTLVLGTTGSGKTTAVLTIACQALAAGWGVVMVDLKGDPGNAAALHAAAAWAGASYRQFSTTPGERCDAWQPLAAGDPAARMSKVICLSDWSEPYYRTACERFAQLAFALLHRSGTPPTFEALVDALDQPLALLAHTRSLDDTARTKAERYLARVASDRGQMSALAGLASRIGTLTDMDGPLTMPTGDERLDLAEVSREGGAVCFTLNSARSQTAAAQIGSLALLDVQSMLAERIRTGDSARPVLVCVDEFSALDADHLVGLFARARSGRVAMLVATQELSDLARVRTGFCEQILGLTNTKLIMRQEVARSADDLARLVGTATTVKHTRQVSTRSLLSIGTGMGTERSVEEFLVHPNTFKRLRRGEGVLVRKDPFRIDRLRIRPRVPTAPPP